MLALVMLILVSYVLVKTQRPKQVRNQTQKEAKKKFVDTCHDEPDWSSPIVSSSKFNFPFKIHFVTYGDSKYEKTMYRLCLQAKATNWFDTITAYRTSMLTAQFKQEFSHILRFPRGGGYMIWKSDIILQKMDQCDPDDIIVYVDSGCTINPEAESRFVEYIWMLHKSNHSNISFQLSNHEFEYTTVQLFQHFGVQHKKDITDSGQLLSGVMLFKANVETRQLLYRFLQVLRDDPKLVTDEYHEINQIKSFIENRHDQSILSLLRKTMGSLILPQEIEQQHQTGDYSSRSPFWATRTRCLSEKQWQEYESWSLVKRH